MSRVDLEQITSDLATQARLSMNEATITEYVDAMQAGAKFPPIVVFHDGTTHWLADGFHRVEAARRAGLHGLDADVRVGDRRDALLHAVGANATHGLRRTNADKRRAVELLLADDEWAAWSNRKIAEAVGVTHPFVAKVRAGEVVTVTTSVDTFPDLADFPEGLVAVDGELIAIVGPWEKPGYWWVSVLTLPHGADGGTIAECKKPIATVGVTGLLEQYGFPQWNRVKWESASLPPSERAVTGGPTWRAS